MPNHRDAKKRHRQNLTRRARNRHYRSQLRTHVKKVRLAVASGKKKDAASQLTLTLPIIGKVQSKGIIHKNTASRLVSRLTKAVNGMK